MEAATQIAQLLKQTLSSDDNAIRVATDSLDRLSVNPNFPFYLLTIASGGESQGLNISAATYLKNFTRRNIESDRASSKVSKEFKGQLIQALLQVEPSVLKILVEVFRVIAVAEFVKENLWPDLVPNLRSAIQNSNLFNSLNSKWNTINALIILRALLRPFQYFLNPKVAKEPVPPQLELIAAEILVPLLEFFHQFVKKALATYDRADIETEQILLTVCKCLHFAIRSYMPSTLVPLLPSFTRDLISILGSLRFDCVVAFEDVHLSRLKTGKRSLLIFSSLVTRHRKHSDKLMPEIINCVLNIVNFSKNISKLDFMSERILSLGFDVISHVLETGPGWRLVSPHFMSLLHSAIIPALVMNEKDVSEWEEDADEYLRKNHPSELDEVSGWREDLFTARKSAMNLLGVISMSKGPPLAASSECSSASTKRKKGEKNKRNSHLRTMGELLVLPFLSKFPIPSNSNWSQDSILNDYFGVLMAYGGLQDFLREQEPHYIISLVQTRILPLYTLAVCLPYLVASANWVLGELGSCLPEEMSADVYSQLLKALVMPNKQDLSCYPVRVSAAGAIMTLIDNDYMPPDWLPLLQVVIGNIGNDDSESSILYQLLSSVIEAGDEKIAIHIPFLVSSLVGSVSKCIIPNLEPWPQVVAHAFAALAVMAKTCESFKSEELKSESSISPEKWASGQAAICRAFAELLQQAWLAPLFTVDQQGQRSTPLSCIEDLSTLLRFVMLSITEDHMIQELKVMELLSVWADMVAEWNAWEEAEDLSVFDCIKEVVNLDHKYGLKNFLVKHMPSPPPHPVPERSVIESISAFISEAILQYPSATWRACSCVHLLLHCPTFTLETESIKQSLAVVFSQAAFTRFREVQSKPCSLWKPLLLAISSCYLCYPDTVEGVLEKGEEGGVAIWAYALCHVSRSSSEVGLTAESDMKLIVMTLAKLIEQLLRQGNSGAVSLQDCFIALLDLSVRLKEVQERKREEEEPEESENDEDDEDSDGDFEDDDDEDSEAEEYEETEEEFLNRYAKAAEELENGSIIEEGDVEDQEPETELGCLIDIDAQKVVLSLIDKYYRVLINGRVLPSDLVVKFLNAFPEHGSYFQQFR